MNRTALWVGSAQEFDECIAVIDPGTWMEHLSGHECWDLLESTPIGRIGVLVDSAPEIYPVNFVVDDRTVDHVVTEHGVAEMRGRSISERARALIAIADPRFRDDLAQEARALSYV